MTILLTSSYRPAVRLLLAAVAAVILSSQAYAAGTPAGTTIQSAASATFEVGGAPLSTAAPASSFVVDRKANLAVTASNATYASVAAGSLSQVLPFLVANTGNDVQDFALSFAHGADPFGGTDNFDAVSVQVFVESGATAGYQAAEDTAGYIDELAADAGRTVYIVADIPAAQANNDISAITLVAAARAGSTPGILGGVLTETAAPDAPNTIDTLFGDPAGDADVLQDAAHSDTSAYRVASVNLSLLKSAAVFDPYGGNRPQTGSTIRYTLSVTLSGTSSAAAVTVTDPLPLNTTYRPGTLRLNGVLLTDAADADAGDVGGTAPAAVTVLVGDMTSASPAQTITFEATID